MLEPEPTPFNTFVLGLASSAMLHLGTMPDPDTNRREVNLPLAQHTIDILAMLQAKTRGNLDEQEHELLDSLLFDLRLRYCKASGGTGCGEN